jgi:hypothetical protein
MVMQRGRKDVLYLGLFIGALLGVVLVSLPILLFGQGMPLAALVAVPFVVLARIAWRGLRSPRDAAPAHDDPGRASHAKV